jgi:hypothetical protein
MRVQAEPGKRELDRVGAADDDRAGAPQPRNHRCISCRRLRIIEHFRPGTGNVAGNIEQILDRHRYAGQRRSDDTVRAQAVAGRCRRLCRFGVVPHEHPRTFATEVSAA